MGVVHRFSPDWGSHIPILIKCLELSEGPVLELGMGASSTILLHSLCFAQDRLLVSYENDGRFIEQFKNFQTPTHQIHFVEDWAKIDIDKPWAVALVDHKPALQRKEEIKRLTDTLFVVVHDTQERADEHYGYEEIYPLFKYRYDYTKFENQTTVLSNKDELKNIFHNSIDK